MRKVHKQKAEAGTAGGKKAGTNSHGSTKLKKVVETKSMPVYICPMNRESPKRTLKEWTHDRDASSRAILSHFKGMTSL